VRPSPSRTERASPPPRFGSTPGDSKARAGEKGYFARHPAWTIRSACWDDFDSAGGAATDSGLAIGRPDAVKSHSPMPTLRPTCVFVTVLSLALSASATQVATTATPIATLNECNPSAHNCPVGKECNCCCGTWVCMPPYLPCCALPCSDSTQLPTPTQSPSATPTCPPLPPFQCLPDYEKVCESDGGCTICRCVRQTTPTATPTLGTCNPLAPDCPSETTCGCCCGAWECLPPNAICCEIACAFPTPPPTPTPTPVPGACGSACDGRPCTGFLIRSGTCQPDGDQCTCIPNTPAPGECALACDSRPCVGQCPNGSTASGFCTYVTVDTGCRCALECSMLTPTPSPKSAAPCVGDCNGDDAVTVDELVRMVNIALDGAISRSGCPGSNQWCSTGPVPGTIGITCVIDAVNDALNGCPL